MTLSSAPSISPPRPLRQGSYRLQPEFHAGGRRGNAKGGKQTDVGVASCPPYQTEANVHAAAEIGEPPVNWKGGKPIDGSAAEHVQRDTSAKIKTVLCEWRSREGQELAAAARTAAATLVRLTTQSAGSTYEKTAGWSPTFAWYFARL
jgi:hypothetical protein